MPPSRVNKGCVANAPESLTWDAQGHSPALAKHYGTVHGVDPSLPMLTDARKRRRTTKRGASNHVTGQNVRFYKGVLTIYPHETSTSL